MNVDDPCGIAPSFEETDGILLVDIPHFKYTDNEHVNILAFGTIILDQEIYVVTYSDDTSNVVTIRKKIHKQNDISI